jgi:DNA-binding SARP family transcriptional activator
LSDVVPFRTGSPADPRAGRLHLFLLGGFELVHDGAAICLPRGSQRLLALVALWHREVKRVQVAGTLWPEASDEHANASLRSELWRLQRAGRGGLDVDASDLRLGANVTVDLHESTALARRLLDASSDIRESDSARTCVPLLSADLLPGWYEDWALVEAERWRQLRMHALEAFARRLSHACRHFEAVETALAAVAVEPLRESAHATLIRVHLDEGNRSEALRAFVSYQDLVTRELGIAPTERLYALVGGLRKRA